MPKRRRGQPPISAMEFNMHFRKITSQAIQLTRKAHGDKQQKLALELGISQASISKIEAMQVCVPTEVLFRLCIKYHMDPNIFSEPDLFQKHMERMRGMLASRKRQGDMDEEKNGSTH